MTRGDMIYFDYLPSLGTRISINNETRGVIQGFDFIQSILKVWIGVYPAQQQLRDDMLGKEEVTQEAYSLYDWEWVDLLNENDGLVKTGRSAMLVFLSRIMMSSWNSEWLEQLIHYVGNVQYILPGSIVRLLRVPAYGAIQMCHRLQVVVLYPF